MIFKLLRCGACLVLAALTVACTAVHANPADDAQARGAIQALQRGDWRALDPQLSPMLVRDPQLHAKLEQVRAFLPVEAPKSVRLIQTQANAVFGAGGGKTSSLTYLATYGSRLVMVNVVFDRTGRAPAIAGLHVVPVDARTVAANRFAAPGKRPGQWAFLTACVLSPLLMLIAAVAAVRTRALPWRWLWAVFAFIGVGAILMDWATGAVRANWLTVMVLGTGASSALPPLTPWILQMTLPVGAVVTLVRAWVARRAPPSAA